jgi:hypothetical protein
MRPIANVRWGRHGACRTSTVPRQLPLVRTVSSEHSTLFERFFERFARFGACRRDGLHWLPVEDYTNKYKGEQVEIELFGGEYQEGTLTAYCAIEGLPHIELNNHILIPLQNIASLHCSSRCDAPEPDWPPRGLVGGDGEDS